MKHPFFKHRFSPAFLAIAGISIFAACTSQGHENKQTEGNEAAQVTYPITPVQYINPTYGISIPGELKPYEQVAVYAKVTGFVKRLLVNRGDRVRKGQLLAILEAPEMEQRYLADKSAEQKVYNDYRYAKQAYERLVDASATTGAVAAIELDRAKTAMVSAESAYESAKSGTAHAAQLQAYLRITAPFDGIVTQRNVSVGALTGAGDDIPLLLIAQDDKLRLTLSLPEKHAASVSPGAKATFTISSQPGKTFEAALSRTSGLLNQNDRSLALEFDVSNPSGELQGGDYAQVKLKLKRSHPSHWVPGKSVLNTPSGTYVMTLKENEIKRVPIKEGIRLDTLTEVFGNLSPTDHIILKPSEEIKEGPINR